MGRRVDIDDLIDAHDVARLLGLAQPNSVHLYQRRYPDMPQPVLDRGGRRARLWLRSEMVAWANKRPEGAATRRARAFLGPAD
jgi:glutathione-regulated potassium-efflux system ancillary protein KefG